MQKLFQNDISLNKETHVYSLKDKPHVLFKSVTTFIGSFFDEFNPPKVAEKLIRTNIKYMHYTPEQLMREWTEAADYGTLVHEEIENYINFKTPMKEKKSVNGAEWLEKYCINSDFEIYSEVMVYSEELGLAGTIDLLLFDKNSSKYSIMDWKTSKRISMRAYKNKKGTHHLTSHIDDCNFNHYSLQLSLYKYILETYYGIEVSDHLIIHLMEDSTKAYHTSYMKNEILSLIGKN